MTKMTRMIKFSDLPSREQKLERWMNVLRVLNNLSDHERQKHWDMSQWGAQTECGTVACAAGHCGMDPWFISQGFELRIKKCDCNPTCYKQYARISDPEDFFGHTGAAIFYNIDPRSVEQVILEIEAYIRKDFGCEVPQNLSRM